MELLYVIIPIAIALVALASWRIFKNKDSPDAAKLPEIEDGELEPLFVLGKIKHLQYSFLYEWVLGPDADTPTIVGSMLSYRHIGGGFCDAGTCMTCYNLTSEAEQLYASGKVFKVFNWNELLSARG